MTERAALEIVSVAPEPSAQERAALDVALKQIAASEKRSRAASVWLRASRARGRRLGMYEYRDRFGAADTWRLSLRFPTGGREFQGKPGRADAR
ncbi:MAG: hypothetical protein M3454_12105 [Actinomycetota bacterium]|nr:hypothetical protein [Actinomycetota bacterium]